MPIIGEYFEREIPPSDNVSSYKRLWRRSESGMLIL